MLEIDLTNKTALVTGASGELGRVICRTLAKCGANLVIQYFNNEKKANELEKEIQSLNRQVITIKADITDNDSILLMKEQINKNYKQIDILVINAVIQYQWTNILEQSPQDYINQFNSCVMQSIYLTKAFVPEMIARKSGRIIGINTECSMQNFPTQSAYVAGKRGMDGIFRVLAKEIGEYQITVNQVAPGWTISERDRLMKSEEQPSYSKIVPLKRRGTDQEIANVVAFLASDLASFITGAFIPVCGGNVMPTI